MTVVKKLTSSRENIILAAMIHDKEALGRIVPIWSRDPLKAESSNIISQLCVDYFSRYGKAPRRHINGLARLWGEESDNTALVSLVERHLDVLREAQRGKYDVPTRQALDVFDKHMKEIRLRRLADSIQAHLDVGRLEDAEEVYKAGLSAQNRGAEDNEDCFHLEDDRDLTCTFEEEDVNLFSYGQELNKFWGNSLQRESFISLISPEGTGKSYWLMDMAYRAVQQRCRVAFFEVGDMSRRQIKRRWAARMAKHPRYPGEYQWPASMDKQGRVQHSTLSFQSGMDGGIVLAARDALRGNFIKSKNSYFYLSSRPAGTLSVSMMETILNNLEANHGWIADCVFIDYADLLAPPKGRYTEKRDQIAENWLQLRYIALKKKCLLVTATQCNREGYDARYGLRMRHVSEEKRKLSHVSHMVGINVTDEEKEEEKYRLNMLKGRDMSFKPNQFACCAGCLALGNPAVVSVFPVDYNPKGTSTKHTKNGRVREEA